MAASLTLRSAKCKARGGLVDVTLVLDEALDILEAVQLSAGAALHLVRSLTGHSSDVPELERRLGYEF